MNPAPSRSVLAVALLWGSWHVTHYLLGPLYQSHKSSYSPRRRFDGKEGGPTSKPIPVPASLLHAQPRVGQAWLQPRFLKQVSIVVATHTSASNTP